MAALHYVMSQASMIRNGISAAAARQKLELQSFIEALDARAQTLERQRRSARSVQPPGPPGAAGVSTVFGGFGRVLTQDVEHMKGEARRKWIGGDFCLVEGHSDESL